MFNSLTIIKRFRLLGTVLFLLILIGSCKRNEDKLGLGVYPDGEQYGVLNTDTVTLITQTSRDDSIVVSGTSIAILGAYADPVFGLSSSSIYAQYQPSSSSIDLQNINSIVIQSVELSLVYTDYYPKLFPLQLEAFELTEAMSSDSVYFSTKDFSTSATNLVTKPVYLPVYEQKAIAVGEEPEQLKIILSKTFGMNLLRQLNTSTDVSAFLEAFKGIKINVSPNNVSQLTTGTGTLLAFNLLSEFSGITVNYTDTSTGDSDSYQFIFDASLARTNRFYHDYSGTAVELALNDSTIGENELYLQAMSGTVVDLQIPYLFELVKTGPISITKAEIIFPIQDGSSTSHRVENYLGLNAKTNSGFYAPIIDETKESNNYGGILQSDGSYVFNITRELQFQLNNFNNGYNLNFGYRLRQTAPEIQMARMVMNGTKSTSNKAKLVISYTPI